MNKVCCQSCGDTTPSYDIISTGSIEDGYRQLCSRCFNAEIAERMGMDDFENLRFDPVKIEDCDGQPHEFHFQLRLLGNIVALEAFEVAQGDPSGYSFQVIGDPEEDMFTLLGKMIQKIRRSLSEKFIDDGDFGTQFAGDVVKGRIESDSNNFERMPVMVIDGREFSWEEFGRMLLTHEGWQFKLEIVDSSQEP